MHLITGPSGIDVEKVSDYSRRLLIASANPLFREGLHTHYAACWSDQKVRVDMTTTMEDTLRFLERHQPDLVIVDHDDRTMNRGEFLNRFVTGEIPMKVILVSLAASDSVVIYKRMNLTADEAEDWLANPWDE